MDDFKIFYFIILYVIKFYLFQSDGSKVLNMRKINSSKDKASTATSKSKFTQQHGISINPDYNEPDNYSFNWPK